MILEKAFDTAKGIDIFGSPILFTTNGSDQASTWPGAVTTIFISLLALSFGYFKFLALYNYTDTTITTVNHLYDLPIDLDYSDFMVAWTVTNRKYEKDALPPSIGRLSVIEWDTDIPNDRYLSREIPLRSCTEKDLAKFYTPHKQNAQAWELAKHAFKCLSDENVSLNLNYDSQKRKNFQLLFFACEQSKFEGRCATENEIKKFFTNHFFMTAQNTERFDASDYTDGYIKKEN